jgi:glycosyltransferase involved in cell wall biosynthesis
MPAISVVLPVFKADLYIEECTGSILTQSFSDFELVIIVNGNHQPTINKIKFFNDPRIQIHFLEKADIVAAVNYAIQVSGGNFIARMDADDIMPIDRLKDQFQYLMRNEECDVVSGKVTFLGDKERNQGYFRHVAWLNELQSHRDIYLNRFVDSPVANPSLMIRKELFGKFGLYKSGGFPEDYEMILRWLGNNVQFGKTESEALKWRDHEERATRNHPMYRSEAFLKIKALYFSQWFKQNKINKEILIWGNGRIVRNKVSFLEAEGIVVFGYIDVVKPTPSNLNPPVYHYLEIPKDKFILSFVGDRKGRLEILHFLEENGYENGKDFYLMN